MCIRDSHKLHKWPHEFLDLEVQERAYVVAAVEMKLEKDRNEMNKVRKRGGGRIIFNDMLYYFWKVGEIK